MTLNNAILMQTLFRKMLYFFCPYLDKGFQFIKLSLVCIFCSRASRCLAWSFVEEGRVLLKQKMKTLVVRWSVRLLQIFFFPVKAYLSYNKIQN